MNIGKAFKRAAALLNGIDPYNAQSHRVIVPISKEQAHRAVELSDADLHLAVAAAREGFDAVLRLLEQGDRAQAAGLFDNVHPLVPRDPIIPDRHA